MTLRRDYMKEIWIDVIGYEGIYEVSNLGRIRTTLGKTTHTQYHGERLWHQRILKKKINKKNKEERVNLYKNNQRKEMLVHRIIAFSFFKEDINNPDITVNHKDGNRLNNNLDNLELLSLAENIRHAFENGLMSTCKPITLYNEKETKTFYSMAQADAYVNTYKGKISYLLRRGHNTINGYTIQKETT